MYIFTKSLSVFNCLNFPYIISMQLSIMHYEGLVMSCDLPVVVVNCKPASDSKYECFSIHIELQTISKITSSDLIP